MQNFLTLIFIKHVKMSRLCTAAIQHVSIARQKRYTTGLFGLVDKFIEGLSHIIVV